MKRYRILFEGDVVAEALGSDDSTFDALIEWTNRRMPLGIVRTGDRSAESAGGSLVTLEVLS